MVEEKTDETKVPRFSGSLLEIAMRSYGPYAFGVVSLLLIWFTIVAPELDSRKLDYEQQTEIVNQQRQIAETMKTTAITMQTTATMMDATTQVLGRAVEKLEKTK